MPLSPSLARPPQPRACPTPEMPAIGAGLLLAVAPCFRGARARRQREIVGAIGPLLRGTLARWRIDTGLRIAHFVAQTAHESAGFRTTEEFASGAAYEGRADLGNTRPGDGRRFKGRGLIQLTGRANYARAGRRLGIDLVDCPERAAEPALSLTIACLYWAERRINAPADRDDLPGVTRRVNGGLRGLADRRTCLVRAKAALAELGCGVRPLLARGAAGAAVLELQAALRDNGVGLAIDGEFGPATERAVRRWQARAGLAADGIVGPRTWGSLGA